MNAVCVFIADDHHALQEGVRLIIEQQQGWKVCGKAATDREAVESARKLSPDVVVLDLVMPEPGTWFAAVLVTGSVAWSQRRRLARSFSTF
jgi:DNA-binding NarL/FixJ family response regulator